MPAGADFALTFATLRGVLKKHGRHFVVTADTPTEFMIASPTMTDRAGRPLFAAGVQIRKSYVSYHLMPVYSTPGLVAGLPPALKKHMQGKSCFNFRTIDPAQVKAVETLTKTGLAGFKNLELPWAQASKK